MDTSATWSEKLAAITGWDSTRTRTIDWPSVESRLGTALPTDYKETAERFGSGEFDGYLGLSTPDAPGTHHDLVKEAERLGAQTSADPRINDLYRPYPVFPAAGGLLRWADSVQADQFFWLTEAANPDEWPILAQAHEDAGEWERFDGSASEFIHRILTDPQQLFSVAEFFDVHTFRAYEQADGSFDQWGPDPHW